MSDLKMCKKKLSRLLIPLVLFACVIEIIYLARSLGVFRSVEEKGVKAVINKQDSEKPQLPADVIRGAASPKFNKATPTNYILFWGLRWGGREPWPPEGWKIDECTVTYDRNKIEEAKALVFHFTTLKHEDFPWTHPRRQEQLYIWWNGETPSAVWKELKTTGQDMESYDEGFFNWTMTYRLDADVFWGYGYRGDMINKLRKGKEAIDDVIAKKKKVAMWLTGNCKYTGEARRRMDYVDAMMAAGLNVSRKGSCFGGYMANEDRDRALTEHKFYLAFENAKHCRDYITEKVWLNSFANSVVPVIKGPLKKDVIKVAPLDSFIFAEDFETPEKLAKYLQYLDGNDTEYRKYFRWREDESMTDEKMIGLIEDKYPNIIIQKRPKGVCERIMENKETRIVKSLKITLRGNDPEECLNNMN